MLAGSATNAAHEEEQIKELSGKLSVKEKEIAEDSRIAELERALASSSSKFSGLENDLKKADDRASAAELESGVHSKKVGELEVALKEINQTGNGG